MLDYKELLKTWLVFYLCNNFMYFIDLEMAAVVLQQSLVRGDAQRPMDDAKARENMANLDVPEKTGRLAAVHLRCSTGAAGEVLKQPHIHAK